MTAMSTPVRAGASTKGAPRATSYGDDPTAGYTGRTSVSARTVQMGQIGMSFPELDMLADVLTDARPSLSGAKLDVATDVIAAIASLR